MTGRPLILTTLVVAVLAVAALFIVPRLGGASAEASDLNLDAQPRLGASDAPVRIVVFEDFLCPACRQFAEDVFPRLEREFVESGDAAIYHKDFVVIGPESERVAQVAQCVFREDEAAFWEFKRVAYRSQDDLNERRAFDLVSEYLPEMDLAAVRTCASEDRALEDVRSDVGTAQAIGLRGTPSVLVDGDEVTATYAAVRSAVEAALAAR